MNELMNTLLIEKFKTFINNKIAEARVDLIAQDGFFPLMLSSTNAGVDEAEIDFEGTSKIEASKMIREHVKNPEVQAIALMFTAYTKSQKADEEREVKADLKDEEGVLEAIMVYLYTKGQCFFRRIPFIKNSDGNYWFGDEGWKEFKGTITGLFSNPFEKVEEL